MLYRTKLNNSTNDQKMTDICQKQSLRFCLQTSVKIHHSNIINLYNTEKTIKA